MTPAIDKERLKLAIQKSGRLTDPCLELLKSCGLKLSRGRDQLMGFGENMPLDVLFVRDDDIPDLVQEDVCDLGLVGRNVLKEKRLELTSRGHPATFMELRPLEYGRCRLSLAVPEGFSYEGARSIAGKRIATTYPFTLERYMRERNITADIVTLSGAVEIAPRLGRADLICDLVSTGSTLQANHLREVETVRWVRVLDEGDQHAQGDAAEDGVAKSVGIAGVAKNGVSAEPDDQRNGGGT